MCKDLQDERRPFLQPFHEEAFDTEITFALRDARHWTLRWAACRAIQHLFCKFSMQCGNQANLVDVILTRAQGLS